MFKTTLSLFLLIFILISTTVTAQTDKNIFIFNIEKDEIIKTVPTSSLVQKEIENYIVEINNVVRKFNPIPEKGYMIKIPLEPSIQIENKWMNALVDEAVLVIPEGEDPYLLIFNDENNPFFFTFEGKIDELLKLLNFSL
ncbi:hypothetical protein AWH56_022845 [Anaerobacillus isosaccharinicus]|uniref:Group-specific protein n=1 Tax=Anaerobacillus isosaccharinicus TaxID=1532552 RepID=A0A1S2LLY4_9BACI|nr:hypothetical protein [Anaerobacillus isosaccharinicus]MBA5586258.1 hypothetical protein [Anaerobacillus isosaccharinicus]QOY35490.1 hypothetical protein AWH56_022845 [Anaerobacillus isosaccharinicus]